VTLDSPPELTGDTLAVTVVYGGCGADELSLCYRPLSDASKGLVRFETHAFQDGTCEAYRRRRHVFDLGRLRRDYIRAFGVPGKPVILEIPGVGSMPYQVAGP
jgi:hypothetical protein